MKSEQQINLICYPRVNKTNQYVALNTRIWEKCGFTIEHTDLLVSELWGVLKMHPDSLLILNWFEDRVSYRRFATLSFLKSVAILILCRLKFKKIIWIKHNLSPHSGKAKGYFSCIGKLLLYLSDSTVIHRPNKGKEHEYIPHPLYLAEPLPYLRNKRDSPFLFFGAIKRYKGVVELLRTWPKSKPLQLIGKCSDIELETELKGIIQSRGLRCNFENTFVDSSRLESLIRASQFVVLPHTEQSMLVTGVFYHAISLGTPCIVSSGAFGKYVQSEVSDTPLFQFDNLDEDIERLDSLDVRELVNHSQKVFSDQRIVEAWQQLIFQLNKKIF